MKNYSMEEAGSLLGCSRREIQNLVNGKSDGKEKQPPRLPHFQVGSRKMIREVDLNRLIEESLRMGTKQMKEWEVESGKEAQNVNRV